MTLQILEVLEIVTFQISLKVRFELWICKCSKHSKTLRFPLQTRYRFMTNSFNKKNEKFYMFNMTMLPFIMATKKTF